MISPGSGARSAPLPNLFLQHRTECGTAGMYLEQVGIRKVRSDNQSKPLYLDTIKVHLLQLFCCRIKTGVFTEDNWAAIIQTEENVLVKDSPNKVIQSFS
jgi:hypothetical protein